MEKIIGIGIREDLKEAIITYKDKTRQRIKLDDPNLPNILNDYKLELEDKLANISKKTEKIKFWNKLLYISVFLFGVSFIYIIVAFMLTMNISLLSLLSLLPLGVSYFEYASNFSEHENDIKLENNILKIIDKIDYISEYADLIKSNKFQNQRQEEFYRRKEKNSQNTSQSYVDVDIDYFINLIDKLKTSGKSLRMQFKNIKRQKVRINNHYNERDNFVAKAISLTDDNYNLRRDNNARMDDIERMLDNFNRGGKR